MKPTAVEDPRFSKRGCELKVAPGYHLANFFLQKLCTIEENWAGLGCMLH